MGGRTDTQSDSPSEPRKNGGASAATSALREDFVELLRPFVNNMPTMACSVFELNALLSRGLPELTALARVVRSDPVLASQVLRSAAPISADSALDKALVLAGLDSLRAIVLRTPVITAAHQDSQRFQAIWHYSNITAKLCEILARFCGHSDREKAYVAGLMHDIGRFALLLVPRCKPSLRNSDNAPGVPLHCVAGAWLARSWNLAPPLVDVIENHHGPALAAKDPFLVTIVAAANDFCNLFHANQASAALRTAAPSNADDVLRRALPFLADRERFALEQILCGELVRHSSCSPSVTGVERTS